MANNLAERVCEVAESKLGSLYWYRRSSTGKMQNYCQGFVADVYFQAGANKTRQSKTSAKEAYRAWCVSTSMVNIPKGAAVYYVGSNKNYGHVGIYVGNDIVIHAWGQAGVVKSTLSNLNRTAKFLGWGWNGGTALTKTTEFTGHSGKFGSDTSKTTEFTGHSGKFGSDTSKTAGTSRDKSLGPKTNPTSGSSGTSSGGQISLDEAQTYGGTTLTVADKTGTPEKIQVYHAQNKESIAKWGLLRYFEEIDTPSIGQNKAAVLLELYNRKTRKLNVSDAFGDINVRAGTLIPVKLNLGDIITNNYMLVGKVTHKFSKDSHTMNLELEGAWAD